MALELKLGSIENPNITVLEQERCVLNATVLVWFVVPMTDTTQRTLAQCTAPCYPIEGDEV